MSNVDDLICAVLRGDNPAWPWADEAQAITALHERAALHGVCPLLHSLLASSDWPAPVLQALRDRSVQQAMWELRHQQLLTQTLRALEAGGLRPVLIKGSALAYSVYADPVLRTRGDTDLLIPSAASEQAHHLLTALGYERSRGVSGDFVSYQASYTQRTADGGSHTLDLHWKINNSELLSGLFTHDELARDADRLPRLCADALGASRVQAMLLACMHRATHRHNPYYVHGEPHYEADRLIWLYDIHLLAGGMSDGEWDVFVQLASQKGLRAVCLDGMSQAGARLGTTYPAPVLVKLAQPGAVEPAAQYLDGGRLRQQWMDMRALGSHSKRLRLMRELLFPPAAYMHGKFGGGRISWLPWLYLRRAVGGIAKRVAGG